MLAACSGRAPQPDATAAVPAADYASLIAAARQSPARADFTRLRDAYANSAVYAPYAMNNADFAPVEAAIRAQEWAQAQLLIAQQLERNYIRIKAHLYAAAIARHTGDTAREQYHLTFYRGLLDSVLRSGDGRTPATAMKVISVEEEYDVLWSRRETMVAQALLSAGDRMLDKLTVRGTGIVTQDVYFDVTVPMRTLPKQ